MRYDLKHWSKGISKLKICIDNTNKALSELKSIEDRRGLSIPEANFWKILKNHLLRLLDYQNKYWKKRCIVRWTKLGDENTNFFHSMASERYRKNSIARLVLPDGSEAVSYVDKERLIFDTYKSRLGESFSPPMLFDLDQLITPTEGLEELSVPFTTTEIDDVVRNLPVDKAPGPDGFNGQFLKTSWHIVKQDIYQLCFDFYEGNLNIEHINMGYITLVPKVGSPVNINDYRPITLLNCCLKILTKLLANRLQKVVLKIVHKNQYGFLKGRTIQDCLAWDFGYIYQCEASKKEIILLKLDFAKAFDTIDHAAMLKIMKSMGFDNNKWMKWIEIIFNSGMSSVLLNGTPGRKFHCRRGVRQGDLLSPLIFVLAADLLQTAINKAFRDNILTAPIPPSNGMDYPVVQYADDTILVMPACVHQLLAMKEILNKYVASTGLHINFHKSSMIPLNLSDASAQNLAAAFQCSIGQMPFTYLGLPMGTTKPTVLDLMPLVDRIERKLSANFMMMAYSGRVTLINSLLTSIAMFTMCSIKVPPKILLHIDKISRNYLWNKKTDDGEKCNSLIAWKEVCKPKNKGGLGVLDLKVQNEALLMKSLHKFYAKHDTPWVHLIWSTYYT